MGILFGLLILVLLVLGLVNRKKRTRTWVKEERHEESGHWIDKRPGERGTWGSLDTEMAQDRQQLVRQGRVVELAELLRAHRPGAADLSDTQRQAFRTYTRDQATQLIATIERISRGQAPPVSVAAADGQGGALKKQVLDFAYHTYPALLELDIDRIRELDRMVGSWTDMVMEEMKRF